MLQILLFYKLNNLQEKLQMSFKKFEEKEDINGTTQLKSSMQVSCAILFCFAMMKG